MFLLPPFQLRMSEFAGSIRSRGGPGELREAPKRLAGLGLISLCDFDEVVKELRRCARVTHRRSSSATSRTPGEGSVRSCATARSAPRVQRRMRMLEERIPQTWVVGNESRLAKRHAMPGWEPHAQPGIDQDFSGASRPSNRRR